MVEEKRLTFGVSGKLYKSALLFYDHQTDSLWSQMMDEAVTGELTGTRLRKLPSRQMTWKSWRELYPNTLALSPDTGFDRDYWRDPYLEYHESDMVMMRDPPKSRHKISLKEQVLGVELGGVAKAYPLDKLKGKRGELVDRIGDKKIVIRFDKRARSVYVTDEANNQIPSVVVYWFAWLAFHPDTLVYKD